MSEDWNTKYGTRRVRRDPPTLDEAIFAAIGITDDQEAQAEIAASLMGLPMEEVQAEVKKAGRVTRAARRRASSPANRARSAPSWSSAALYGNSATTSGPGPSEARRFARTKIVRVCVRTRRLRRPAPAIQAQQHFPPFAVEYHDRTRGIERRRGGDLPTSADFAGFRSMLPVDSPWRNVRCAPNLWASARIASLL